MLVSVSTCSNRSNRTTSWSRPLPTSPNTWLTPAAMDTMGLDDLSFGRRTIVPNCGDARLRGESASPKIVGDVFRRDAILVAMLFDSLRRRFAGRIGPAHQREIAMKSAGRDHWAACNTAAIEFQIANCAAEAIRYKFSDQEYALPPRFIRSHRSAGPKMRRSSTAWPPRIPAPASATRKHAAVGSRAFVSRHRPKRGDRRLTRKVLVSRSINSAARWRSALCVGWNGPTSSAVMTSTR